ncbi:MAG: DUF4136 domain-containing protein [Bacteroidota bacterium]|jgi:hypothetical protein
MKSLSSFTGLLLAFLLFTGCAQRAYHQHDDSFDLTSVSTYAWADADDDKNYETKRNNVNSIRDTKIKRTIDKYLQAHGWKLNNANPDVFLVFDVVVDQSQQNVNVPVYSQPMTRWYYNPATRRWVPIFYPSNLVGFNSATRQVREGTLTLSMMNPVNDKAIWQGWTTSEIYGKKISDEKIDRDVKAIIKELKKY